MLISQLGNRTYRLRHFMSSDLVRLTQFADQNQTDLITNVDHLTRFCWLAESASSELIGYNYLTLVPHKTELQIWLFGVVAKRWHGQGIGSALLGQSWQDITVLLNEMPQINNILINSWAKQDNQCQKRLLTRFGLQPYHVYHELSRSLDNMVVPSKPLNIMLKAWRMTDCTKAVALRNRAFANNWGYQPTSVAALHRRFQGKRYEPSFSFTAWHGTQMVGLIHGIWQPILAYGEAVWLAVEPTYRGQGVGRALLLKLMHAFRQTGAQIVKLSTDSHAHTPQIDLYLKLGFTVDKAIVDYQASWNVDVLRVTWE